MRKNLFILALVLVAASLVGCDAVQRKFTRKPKTVKAPRIYQLDKYEKTPTPALYSKHFAYWQSWQSELIQRLGENEKKDKRCIEEILMQLDEMQNMLVKEKADALGKHIRRLQEVRDTITRQNIDRYNRGPALMVLEREDRYINSDFCVSKMKNYIKTSFDEGPQNQPQAAE